MRPLTLFFALLTAIASPSLALPNDTFNAGVSSWSSGSGSEPLWVSSGGNPGGCLDMQSGPGGANKQVMFNQGQWAFNFTAAGVSAVRFDAKTSYSSPLNLRIAMDGAGGQIGSSQAASLSNDGLWHTLTVPVTAADMSDLGGSNVPATLANVSMLRILNNDVPSFSGLPIVADVYYDNIVAVVRTPTVTPSFSVSPTLTPSPSISPTFSASPSFSASPTQSESVTISPTFSASPTAADSFTISPTFSGSPTLTATATPTTTPTATLSKTPSATRTLTLTRTATPSSTATPASTRTPVLYGRSWVGHAALGPQPAHRNEPLCLYLSSAPLSSQWDVFNSAGEAVAHLSFGAEVQQCWDHAGVAPGLYVAHLKVRNADGAEERLQKLVFLP